MKSLPNFICVSNITWSLPIAPLQSTQRLLPFHRRLVVQMWHFSSKKHSENKPNGVRWRSKNLMAQSSMVAGELLSEKANPPSKGYRRGELHCYNHHTGQYVNACTSFTWTFFLLSIKSGQGALCLASKRVPHIWADLLFCLNIKLISALL